MMVSVTVREIVYIIVCLIRNRYWDSAVWISRPNSVRLFFKGLDGGRGLNKKCGSTRGIAGSHFLWCCPHTEMHRSTQTNKMRSCKVRWGWRWNFLTFMANCNKFCHFCVKICHLSVKLNFIKLTVSNFSFFITIHNDFIFVDSYSSISVTIRNKTHVLWTFSCNGRYYHLPKYWPYFLNHPV